MTQESTHLHGCTEPDIDAIAAAIAPSLDLQFENRDSAYWGDYHIDRSGAFSELRLYRNRDPMFRPDSGAPEDEYWFEPDFRDCASLLYVYADHQRLLEFHKRLIAVAPQFRLLKPSTIGT